MTPDATVPADVVVDDGAPRPYRRRFKRLNKVPRLYEDNGSSDDNNSLHPSLTPPAPTPLSMSMSLTRADSLREGSAVTVEPLFIETVTKSYPSFPGDLSRSFSGGCRRCLCCACSYACSCSCSCSLQVIVLVVVLVAGGGGGGGGGGGVTMPAVWLVQW